MNILIMIEGRSVKVVKYFNNTLDSVHGKVITTDINSNALALSFRNKYEIVSRIDSPNYIEEILNICKKYKIDGIVSLIDPELELLARNIKIFEKHNVKLVLSPMEIVEITFDKFETY